MVWPGWALTLQSPVLTWDTLVSGPTMRWGPWAFSGVGARWCIDGSHSAGCYAWGSLQLHFPTRCPATALVTPAPCPRLGLPPGARPAPLGPRAAEECPAVHQPGVTVAWLQDEWGVGGLPVLSWFLDLHHFLCL